MAPALISSEDKFAHTGERYDLFVLHFGTLESDEGYPQVNPSRLTYEKLAACVMGRRIEISEAEKALRHSVCLGGVPIRTNLSEDAIILCLKVRVVLGINEVVCAGAYHVIVRTINLQEEEEYKREYESEYRPCLEFGEVSRDQDGGGAYGCRIDSVIYALIKLEWKMKFELNSGNWYIDVGRRLRLTAELSRKTGRPETIGLEGERHSYANADAAFLTMLETGE